MDGLIKTEHLQKKTLFNNGDWRIRTAEKPTATELLEQTQRQYVSGGKTTPEGVVFFVRKESYAVIVYSNIYGRVNSYEEQ